MAWQVFTHLPPIVTPFPPIFYPPPADFVTQRRASVKIARTLSAAATRALAQDRPCAGGCPLRGSSTKIPGRLGEQPLAQAALAQVNLAPATADVEVLVE